MAQVSLNSLCVLYRHTAQWLSMCRKGTAPQIVSFVKGRRCSRIANHISLKEQVVFLDWDCLSSLFILSGRSRNKKSGEAKKLFKLCLLLHLNGKWKKFYNHGTSFGERRGGEKSYIFNSNVFFTGLQEGSETACTTRAVPILQT